MWQLPELIPHIRKEATPLTNRLFFALYYKVPDNAFKLAAESWISNVCLRHGFKAGLDKTLAIEVLTEADFVAAWTRVHQEASVGGLTVYAGNLLTHAFKDPDAETSTTSSEGLAFKGSALTHQEIVGLQKLNWATSGFLILSGCNAANVGSRQWAPAHSFALIQRVPTVGNVGYSYFSTQWGVYSRFNGEATVGLWAYRRKSNGLLGNGERMAGIVFKV
jgi:hypothetical protein